MVVVGTGPLVEYVGASLLGSPTGLHGSVQLYSCLVKLDLPWELLNIETFCSVNVRYLLIKYLLITILLNSSTFFCLN